MTVLSRFKTALARRALRSPRVREMARAQLLTDPTLLTEIAETPALRNRVLERAQQIKAFPSKMLLDDAAMNRILHSPDTFERILERVSRNPESLFKLLSVRRLRNLMAAQTTFLAGIAHTPAVLDQVVAQVPRDRRPDTLRALLGNQIDQIRTALDAPEDLALALSLLDAPAQGSDVPDHDPQVAAAIRSVATQFSQVLGARAPQALAEMLARRPDTLRAALKAPALTDFFFEQVLSDDAVFAEAFVFCATTSRSGGRPADRIRALLAPILSVPVFRRAMQSDPALREQLLAAVRDGYESAGEDAAAAMGAVLSAPSGPSGPAARRTAEPVNPS